MGLGQNVIWGKKYKLTPRQSFRMHYQNEHLITAGSLSQLRIKVSFQRVFADRRPL